MAKITTTYISGSNLYFLVLNEDGEYWNTDSAAFEAYDADSYNVDDDYSVALTEDGSSGIYQGDYPASANMLVGKYTVICKLRAGASPADSDLRVGGETVGWDGVALSSALYDAAVALGYTPTRCVIVPLAATYAARGLVLKAAYARAKTLSPAVDNRITIMIPPGWYQIATSALVADTDYIDMIAMEPEGGGDLSPSDVDETTGSATSLDQFRPSRTLIYTSVSDGTTIEQSCNVMRAVGFSVANMDTVGTDENYAWYVSADENQGSEYDRIYCWHITPAYPAAGNSWRGRSPVGFNRHVDGIWTDCIANAYSWRVGRQDSDAGDGADDSEFRATMRRVQGGYSSFGGDCKNTGARGTYGMVGCRMIDCHCIGKNEAGYTGRAFSGCGTFSIPIDSDCYFQDCTSGDNSFVLDDTNAGTFIRCRAGDKSFAGNAGQFSGYAEDCIAGSVSFGMNTWLTSDGRLSGTLRRCVVRSTVAGTAKPWSIEGATIIDCLFSTSGTTNPDCFTLVDSLSQIHNSTLLVVEGGNGVAINAGSALNVSAVGNRYNNVDASATGLGANVTNTGMVSDRTGFSLSPDQSGVTIGTVSDKTGFSLSADQSGVTIGTVTTNTDMRGTDNAATAAQLAAADVTTTSPVTSDEDIEIVQYDDYLAAYSRSLSWSNSGGDWFDGDLTDAAVALTFTDRAGTVILTKAGSVTTATGTQVVSVDLTSANTALFTKPGKQYKYQLLLTKATYRETEVTGDVTVTITNNEPD